MGKIQILALGFGVALAIENFVPGFFSGAVRRFQINSLLGQFRKQEQQESVMKVEDVSASQTSPNFSPPGGL